MSEDSDKATGKTGKAKTPNLGLTAAVCVVFAAAMIGMSFAASPLYGLFCQATGLGGTTQTATKAPDKTIDRYVTVRFDANVANGLGWSFRPLRRSVAPQGRRDRDRCLRGREPDGPGQHRAGVLQRRPRSRRILFQQDRLLLLYRAGR